MPHSKTIRCRMEDTCILCGSSGLTEFENLEDVLFGVEGKWNIMKCPNDGCGLVWIVPMPESDQIPKLYKQYYTHKKSKSLPDCLIGLYEHFREGILASAYGYSEATDSRFWLVLGKILSWVPFLRERVGGTVMWLDASRTGRVLDIGCGSGKLLKRLHKVGWDVAGIEPDSKAADFAMTSCGLDVHACSLEDAEFPDASFDVITMHHVIEHLPDPCGTLRECWRILRKGGRLVSVTPNSISSGRKRYGKDWRGFEVPRHLHVFNPVSLERIHAGAGFTLAKSRTLTRNSASIWKGSDSIRRKRLTKGAAGKRRSKVLCFGKVLIYIVWAGLLHCVNSSGGEEILVVSKKV